MAICLQCKDEFTPKRNTFGKYCSNRCQSDYQHHQYIKRWKNGEETGHTGKTLQISNHVRKYLLEKADNACSSCGWNKLHPIDNLPLVETDHIDGDASNTVESNLRVLCPNCHSMTSTFRARNKNSKRKR